jgi:hypothetical protein
MATWVTRRSLAIAVALSVLAIGAARGAVAQEDAVAGVVNGLGTHGPWALLAGVLLWRQREREQEHAVERGAAWGAITGVREEVAKGNQTLARIETILQERRGPGGGGP